MSIDARKFRGASIEVSNDWDHWLRALREFSARSHADRLVLRASRNVLGICFQILGYKRLTATLALRKSFLRELRLPRSHTAMSAEWERAEDVSATVNAQRAGYRPEANEALADRAIR